MLKTEKILFKDWALYWLEYQKNFIKESTYGTYSTVMYNHLIPIIGDIPVMSINEKSLQDLVLMFSHQGRKDGTGGLSEKTVKNIMTILKICLQKAGKEGITAYIKPSLLYPKSQQRNQLFIFDRSNQTKIQNTVLSNLTTKSFGILFALQTGVRIGELCAIQYKDIDVAQRIVMISKTIQRIFMKNPDGKSSTKVIITPPKSLSSQRIIPLSDILVGALQKLSFTNENVYLLTGNKDYTEPRSYLNYYKRFLNNVDIEYINFHGLRHTFATRCIEGGGDSKTVSELLGHSSINITMDLYVHPQMETKRKCIEMVNIP